MATDQLSHLRETRRRRQQRLELTYALHAADPDRSKLIPELHEALRVVGGDRAALVWLDEFGEIFPVEGGIVIGGRFLFDGGPPRTHLVVDLASDVPRRRFPMECIFLARDAEGPPGIFDVPDVRAEWDGPVRPDIRSVVVVSIGHDGLREWFLAVDGRTPRSRLGGRDLGRLVFLAGRCSGLILHCDLSAERSPLAPEGSEATHRFAESGGWPILQDMDDERAATDQENLRFAIRFLLARLLRRHLDDGLPLGEEAFGERVDRIRDECSYLRTEPRELALWEAVLEPVISDEPRALGRAVLALAEHIEEMEDLWSAREFYRSAYEVAMGRSAGAVGVAAAAGIARVCRKKSDDETASVWEDVGGRLEELVAAIS